MARLVVTVPNIVNNMAHKLLPFETIVKKETRLKLPNIQGKFGLSIFIGGRELFLGLSINEVVMEQVIRRKFIKTPKGTAKTFNFDPL